MVAGWEASGRAGRALNVTDDLEVVVSVDLDQLEPLEGRQITEGEVIRAGTGGDEAALFAGDLFRMYSRYAEKMRWKIDIIDSSPTDLGGFKEIVMEVTGKKVYHYLQYESGGHRV